MKKACLKHPCSTSFSQDGQASGTPMTGQDEASWCVANQCHLILAPRALGAPLPCNIHSRPPPNGNPYSTVLTSFHSIHPSHPLVSSRLPVVMSLADHEKKGFGPARSITMLVRIDHICMSDDSVGRCGRGVSRRDLGTSRVQKRYLIEICVAHPRSCLLQSEHTPFIEYENY